MKKYTLVLTIILIACLSGYLKAQPSAPTGLKANQQTINNFIFVNLTWDSSSQRNIGYVVYRKEGAIQDSGSFKKYPLMMANHNSFVDYLVKPGKTYSYFITARNRSGESPHSDTVEITLGNAVAKSIVSGKITDSKSGAAINGASITFIPVKGWDASRVKSDSSGNYSTNLYPGNYIVFAQAPKYFSSFFNNAKSIFDAAKITVDSAALTLNISLTPITPPVLFTITGKVTDSAGVPLRASVEAILLNSTKSFMHHFGKNRIRRTFTDSLGNYSIKLSANDSVVVFAQPISRNYIPQFYNNKTEFAEANPLLITADLSGINFIIQHKPVFNNSISGRIRNQDSLGVVGSVTAFKLNVKGEGLSKKSILTDSLGNYTISNLSPGNYILLAIPFDRYIPSFFKYDGSQTLRWKEADSVVVTATSQLTGYNITVSNIPDSGFADISGKVIDNNGTGINGASVFVTDVNGNTSSFATTDTNGNYSLSGLVPGTYTISTDKFSFTSGQQNSITLDYQTNLSKNVQLTLTPTEITSVSTEKVLPEQYSLDQNYPNPFNPSTVISYQLPGVSNVQLKIYDILGREVATLVNTVQGAGSYKVQFDGSKLSSGMYMYVLKAGSFVQTRKMMLLK